MFKELEKHTYRVSDIGYYKHEILILDPDVYIMINKIDKIYKGV